MHLPTTIPEILILAPVYTPILEFSYSVQLYFLKILSKYHSVTKQ